MKSSAFTMFLSGLLFALFLSSTTTATLTAKPRQRRQDCPAIHIFGARETTTPQGFGSSQKVIELIVAANDNVTVTSEAIVYPAAPGTAYASSVTKGIGAVMNQTMAFNAQCPNSMIIMVGYSQVEHQFGLFILKVIWNVNWFFLHHRALKSWMMRFAAGRMVRP
jgi:hypothetical protein